MTWDAWVHIKETEDGLRHVYCSTIGDSTESALDAAEFVIDKLSAGQRTFVRDTPQAHGDRDFNTKEWRYMGGTRFTVSDEAGGREYIDTSEPIKIPDVGAY